MVEEAIRFGTRVNGDSGFRVSLVCRFGGGTRNFGGQHDVQRNVQKRRSVKRLGNIEGHLHGTKEFGMRRYLFNAWMHSHSLTGAKKHGS